MSGNVTREASVSKVLRGVDVDKIEREPNLTENSLKVLQKRYLRKNENGEPVETPRDMFQRVAENVALAELKYGSEKAYTEVANVFYDMMSKLEFLPNSPTLMNAGRKLQQLSACFVLPIDDSIDDIFEIIKNTALIHKSGGGTGFSFSRIRPMNDIVTTSHGLSSGPISFMKVFNQATEAINQGGFRRGANMAVLRVDHPDIEDFITAKSNENELNNFNISVGITEEFMDAVKNDKDYTLYNPRTKEKQGSKNAKKIFDLIVQMAWKNGEPGIVFLDRLNRDNPTPGVGEIESTNPCGEQPLLSWEACNLGSINLNKMIKDNKIDFPKLEKTVKNAVRFLDNVIEMNKYPLDKIDKMTKSNRKIGLGIMGFADLLIKLGIPYNSKKATNTAEEIMSFVNTKSKEASAELSKQRGTFPNFDKSIFAPAKNYLRNATTTTIAPTGTIGIIAGASSGIEPLFAVCYVRNVMDGEELIELHPMLKKIAIERGFYSEELIKKLAEHGSLQDVDEIPEDVKDIFVTAHEISPEWHIKMQAAFQKYTDNAVSKTVNFANTATKDDISEVYMLAYDTGCKGVTVYRDGCRQEQVLQTGKTKKHMGTQSGEIVSDVAVDEEGYPVMKPRPRPDMTIGTTRKLRTGCGNIYVTLNCDENGRPFEIFSIMGKAGGCAASQSEAIARLISFALRSGVDPYAVVRQLKGISCHSVAWGKGGKIMSCADAIAKALELSLDYHKQHVASMKDNSDIAAEEKKINIKMNYDDPTVLIKGACPDCGGILEHESGCATCKACGFSECG